MTPGDAETRDLRDAVSTVAARISQYRGKAIGEQNTKAALIEPILRALGWDVEDVDEVRREYRHTTRFNPADYAFMLLREPKLFVEAKALGENLDDEKWAVQVISYAATAGVPWVALTDGDEYRIYNALARVGIEDKLFRRARLSEDAEASVKALAHLSRDEIQADSLDSRWKAEQADRRVREAVEEMLSPPAEWLLRGLDKRIGDLAKGEIRAALERLRITVDSPSAPALEPPSVRTGGTDRQGHPPPKPRRRGRRPAPARKGRGSTVTLSDLIRAGLISAPCTLSRTYLGRGLEATLQTDGLVVFEGHRFESPSMAAAAARLAVKGAPPDGTRKVWQTNGWIFWEVVDGDGRRVVIDELRRRYLDEARPA